MQHKTKQKKRREMQMMIKTITRLNTTREEAGFVRMLTQHSNHSKWRKTIDYSYVFIQHTYQYSYFEFEFSNISFGSKLLLKLELKEVNAAITYYLRLKLPFSFEKLTRGRRTQERSIKLFLYKSSGMTRKIIIFLYTVTCHIFISGKMYPKTDAN